MLPSKIRLTDQDALSITWDEGSVTKYSLLQLRKMCPCAICSSEVERHSHSHTIYRDDQIKIDKIAIVGNYALAISWKDGHNTGIYEFQYLITISETY